jgi:15-cis-phytoene synthase
VARDTSFYYAFLMLPPARRNAIVAVWDFCRAVDDAVDEAVPAGKLTDQARATAAVELAQWRAEVERCFTGGRPSTPQGRGLAPLVPAFALAREPFDDLIDGVEMDLRHVRYETFDELVEYCRRVASAVGLVCVQIFGCREPGARDYAVNLGLALQLTNIVRDVGTDLASGRVYLPQEDLRRFGVTERELAAGQVTPPIRALLKFQCERAREYFARAARSLPHAEARRLVAAEIMGAIYAEILRRVERNDYDVFSHTIRVPRPARAWIALTTWARTLSRALGAEPVHA